MTEEALTTLNDDMSRSNETKEKADRLHDWLKEIPKEAPFDGLTSREIAMEKNQDKGELKATCCRLSGGIDELTDKEQR